MPPCIACCKPLDDRVQRQVDVIDIGELFKVSFWSGLGKLLTEHLQVEIGVEDLIGLWWTKLSNGGYLRKAARR